MHCIFLTSFTSIILDACYLLPDFFPLHMVQELVPCVLLSFDNEQILMWRGRDWTSMYQDAPLASNFPEVGIAGGLDGSGMC